MYLCDNGLDPAFLWFLYTSPVSGYICSRARLPRSVGWPIIYPASEHKVLSNWSPVRRGLAGWSVLPNLVSPQSFSARSVRNPTWHCGGASHDRLVGKQLSLSHERTKESPDTAFAAFRTNRYRTWRCQVPKTPRAWRARLAGLVIEAGRSSAMRSCVDVSISGGIGRLEGAYEVFCL